MKAFVLVCMIFMAGCVSKAPKEELLDIFSLVKDKKFDEAKSIVESTKATSGWYLTYSGEDLHLYKQPYSGEPSVEELLEDAKSNVELCEKKLKEVKARSLSNRDHENQQWFSNDLESFESEFERHCANYAIKNGSLVRDIKKYSSVDLSDVFIEFLDKFKLEASRIKNEAQNKEKQDEQLSVSRQAKQKEYLDSSAYISKSICQAIEELDYRKNQLSKEKEISKIGGVTNSAKVYEISKNIQFSQDLALTLKKNYKNKSGKTWMETDCSK